MVEKEPAERTKEEKVAIALQALKQALKAARDSGAIEDDVRVFLACDNDEDAVTLCVRGYAEQIRGLTAGTIERRRTTDVLGPASKERSH